MNSEYIGETAKLIEAYGEAAEIAGINRKLGLDGRIEPIAQKILAMAVKRAEREANASRVAQMSLSF